MNSIIFINYLIIIVGAVAPTHNCSTLSYFSSVVRPVNFYNITVMSASIYLLLLLLVNTSYSRADEDGVSWATEEDLIDSACYLAKNETLRIEFKDSVEERLSVNGSVRKRKIVKTFCSFD